MARLVLQFIGAEAATYCNSLSSKAAVHCDGLSSEAATYRDSLSSADNRSKGGSSLEHQQNQLPDVDCASECFSDDGFLRLQIWRLEATWNIFVRWSCWRVMQS